jgi:hypothetical protein
MKLSWDLSEWLDFADRAVNTAKFNEFAKLATKQLAKELQDMLFATTPVKTGQLSAGWGGSENYAYTIKSRGNGFSVTLYNRVPYAKYVNDGHYLYNQFNVGGAPYVVKRRTPKIYTAPNAKRDATYVFGHFFVEKSIVTLENQNILNKQISKELDKWFRWCVSGK